MYVPNLSILRMQQPDPAPAIERGFMAMGTFVLASVVLNRAADKLPALNALDEVERMMNAFGRDAWAWGDGALAQMNRRLAAGEAAGVPPQLAPLFARAGAIRAATEGLFEPRIGALVHLWGFDDPARLRSTPPAAAEIDALLARMRAAPATPEAGRLDPGDVTWDFGAIGKGYIVDAALALLRQRGFENTLINAGGNVAVRGARGDRAWRVGVRDPRAGTELPQILAALDACDEAVITHGDDQRHFDHGGRRYAHILDPRTGMPAQGLRSLSVVHTDGTLADAGGAALFVAGRAGWPRLAAKLGIDQVVAVAADGSVQASVRLLPRLQPHADVGIEAA